MPFINVMTNSEIKNKDALKAELGNDITAIPGKSEAWLMVKFDENLTKRICKTSEKYLGIPSNRTYVKYNEIDKWGYDNFNF